MGNLSNPALAGTETEKNLYTALSGEAQASLKYQWYGRIAAQQGSEAAAELFQKTSDNETEHAEIWFKHLGSTGNLTENLDAAAGGEHYEWSVLYDGFAQKAEEEGFSDIASEFRMAASVEKLHEARFRQMAEEQKNGTAFSAPDAQTAWVCLNCGYTVTGTEPPMVCPLCGHPQAYYKKQC